MRQPTVLQEQSGDMAILTLNRPDKLNALSYATIDALMQILDAIEESSSIKAIILTGSGRAFCAGADISEFSLSIRRGVEPALREFVRRGQNLTARLEAYPKPIVAAVNGIAFGGGCEMIEAIPLAIASER